jgi:[ribosomal protein S5]-alanine N-acetyltransferase
LSKVSYASAVSSRLRPERPWREHARLYIDLFADRTVAAALWPGALGGPRTAAQAAAMLEADIEHWQREAFGPWVFFEAQTGMFVGRGGLRRGAVAGRECVEVLYAVRSDAWGRGYAGEMTRTALALARRLGMTEVVGVAARTNVASLRVLSREGIRFESVVEHAGLPHELGRFYPQGQP